MKNKMSAKMQKLAETREHFAKLNILQIFLKQNRERLFSSC